MKIFKQVWLVTLLASCMLLSLGGICAQEFIYTTAEVIPLQCTPLHGGSTCSIKLDVVGRPQVKIAVIIPRVVKNGALEYTVVALGKSAFHGQTDHPSVTLPSTIARIEEDAFSGCTKLATAELPASLTELGSRTFQGRAPQIQLPSAYYLRGFCSALCGVS